MRLNNPYIPLAILFATAAALFVGGSRLARRVETVRVARDREPLIRSAEAIQTELGRLEHLYESHLQQIARDLPADDDYKAITLCRWVTGIRQASIFARARPGAPKTYTAGLDGQSQAPLPSPLLEPPKHTLLPGTWFLVPGEITNAPVSESGWLDAPGRPLCYWYSRAREIVLLTLNPSGVAQSMNEWLRGWLELNPYSSDPAGGFDEMLGPQGVVLRATGKKISGRQPDFVLPIRTRFGAWQLLAWDGWETRSYYHLPTLALATALSIFIGLLGLGVFVQQRRAIHLAEQRVSFINRVSHELRTPLTNILLNIDLAVESLESEPSRAVGRLALVQEEGRRLSRLIENVLTFSRREQGRLQLKPGRYNPADIVRSVIRQFEPTLKRRSIEVTARDLSETPCLLDADAFTQILTNLVSNVEKYAPRGRLEIVMKLEGGRLILVISDSGPGIPAKEADRIFQPFHRIDRSIREGVTGTGLGLTIARDLAGRMSGTLRLLPTATGASFQLDLPADADQNT